MRGAGCGVGFGDGDEEAVVIDAMGHQELGVPLKGRPQLIPAAGRRGQTATGSSLCVCGGGRISGLGRQWAASMSSIGKPDLLLSLLFSQGQCRNPHEIIVLWLELRHGLGE